MIILVTSNIFFLSDVSHYFNVMKYLKWLWLVSVLAFIVYFVNEWDKRGFDSVLFASGIGLLVAGIGLLSNR